MTVWTRAPRGLDDLLDRLQRNDASLSSLCLFRSRKFEAAEAKALCQVLSGPNTCLRELVIGSHAVDAGMAAAFADMLAANKTLTSLSLGNSTFGDQALAALCRGLAFNQGLRRLDLESKGITSAGCGALAEALAGGNSLQELVLAQNDLGNKGLAELCPAAGRVQLLDLRACGLAGAEGTRPLLAALAPGRLRRLHLEENALGAEGAQALAPGLAACASLRELHLRGAGLGPRGAAALAQGLPPALDLLDLSGNAIGPAGAAALAGALAVCSASSVPASLLLCQNGLDDGSLAALAASWCRRSASSASSSSARSLDLSSNRPGRAALAALAGGAFSALCMHDCALGSENALALAQMLASAPATSFLSLTELDLSGNDIGAEAMLALLAALSSGGGDDAAAPFACPRLRLLVLAANPGLEHADVDGAVGALQAARPGVDVVRRAADTGESGMARLPEQLRPK